MNEWIGLIGVVLGSVISGIVSYLANKQNHKNSLEAQKQIYKLENKKLYAKKQEELMSELLQIISLTQQALEDYAEYQSPLGVSRTLKNKISELKDKSILKAHLYFPEIIATQKSYFQHQAEYIDAIDKGSHQLDDTYGIPLKTARNMYLDALSKPLSQKLLLDNP